MEFLKCCFGCATVFGCKNVVVRRTAFFPPKPAGYSFSAEDSKFQLVDSSGKAHPPMDFPWLEIHYTVLKTSRGDRIPSIYFEASQAEFVLLFCHGNSTDLGFMYSHMVDLATELNCSVFAFEYTGYGPLNGKASESSLYADIRAAYQHLIADLKVHWKKIVVYGQSLGSALACDLASELPCAGVVLHSPIASGLRIFARRETSTASYDIFTNIEKVPYIRCPIFILHGTADREVPIRHSEWLSRLMAVQWPAWWVPDGGHNDLEIRFRDDYLAHMRDFLSALRALHAQFACDLERYEALKPISKTVPVKDIPKAGRGTSKTEAARLVPRENSNDLDTH